MPSPINIASIDDISLVRNANCIQIFAIYHICLHQNCIYLSVFAFENCLGYGKTFTDIEPDDLRIVVGIIKDRGAIKYT